MGSGKGWFSSAPTHLGLPLPLTSNSGPKGGPTRILPSRRGSYLFFTVIARLLQRTIFHVAVKVADERTEPLVIDGACVVTPEERLRGVV